MGLRLTNQYKFPYNGFGSYLNNTGMPSLNPWYANRYNRRSTTQYNYNYSPFQPSYARRDIIVSADPVAGETITLPLHNGTLQAFDFDYSPFSGAPFSIPLPATPTDAEVAAAIMTSYNLWHGSGDVGINIIAGPSTDRVRAVARTPGITMPTITEAATGVTLGGISAAARSHVLPGRVGKKFCFLPGQTNT